MDRSSPASRSVGLEFVRISKNDIEKSKQITQDYLDRMSALAVTQASADDCFIQAFACSIQSKGNDSHD